MCGGFSAEGADPMPFAIWVQAWTPLTPWVPTCRYFVIVVVLFVVVVVVLTGPEQSVRYF